MNGTNADGRIKTHLHEWLARHAGEECISGSKPVDIKAAIVEEFRDRSSILIATEAAAEGVNLQFCSLVVNFDLPWNPQRIEQRIGRCHRYGQRHDVVVVNFLNRRNEADQRVFELLSEKVSSVDGVFGSSDEVLGALSRVSISSDVLQAFTRVAEVQRRLPKHLTHCSLTHGSDSGANGRHTANLLETSMKRLPNDCVYIVTRLLRACLIVNGWLLNLTRTELKERS